MSNRAIVNLNGGEFTPKIDARSDVEKFASGLRDCKNMIPTIFGGVTRRPGTEFISSSGVFDTILSALVAYDNIDVCHENTATVTVFEESLDQISCWQNDIICHENEIVVETDLMTFVSRALCHENNVVFYENDTVIV